MNQIRYIRKQVFKVGQVEFARIAKVGQATVSRWEAGETSPSLNELRSIRNEAAARAIAWDHDWLFGNLPAAGVQAAAYERTNQ